MPRIFRCDNIDLFQDVESSQRDIAQVTNRGGDYVKHFTTSCKLDAALSREVHSEPNKANWLLPNESLNGGKMRTTCYLSSLTLLVFAGCTTEPTTVTTTTTTQEVTTARPTRDVVVTRPPPPLRVETQTIAPGPGYVWTAGYWRWTGTTYVWTPGTWVVRPRTSAVWVAGHWVPRYNGWVWVPGHWQ